MKTRSKVVYRMSSNWQAPLLFFNALGMIDALNSQQRGQREGLLERIHWVRAILRGIKSMSPQRECLESTVR